MKTPIVRANKELWRIAEWLQSNMTISWIPDNQARKNFYYDKAAELMKKIRLNEFTGTDQHGD